MKIWRSIGLVLLMFTVISAGEYHVSKSGNDTNNGSAASPLNSISAAALLAQAGDTITVHQGIYRERINPPRGGVSNEKRIVYRAAPGEEVTIKGSEIIEGWQRMQKDTWKVTIQNSFFGNFNPYKDLISGDWFNPLGRDHHTGALYLNNHWLTEAAKLDDVLNPIEDSVSDTRLWFAQVDSSHTTIWAQFKDIDPNNNLVEINIRQTVFYPEKPGINYITVSGFKMMHAATPWAPPTAEQIGLIGTHWSKGWIIENNTVRYSICTGITLGKYGDMYDNRSKNSAGGYVKTIERAKERGWSKENIGGHIVRNNHISHCEQAGIVGSLGAVFSVITGNTIHDIHLRHLFSGDEMAAIKIHGAIDIFISGNHIYRAWRGIWLDWMTQGTRVSRNLLHDNGPGADILVEVNHGPFVVDHNLLLSGYSSNKFSSESGYSLNDVSQGGTYAHNMFAGFVVLSADSSRKTPFNREHSTEVAGIANVLGGDSRYYNNIFIGYEGLASYDEAILPVQMAGNVFLKGARASTNEKNACVQPHFNPDLQLIVDKDGVFLNIKLDKAWSAKQPRKLVTTQLLGKAKTPDLHFVQPDGSLYRIDTDYFGHKRNTFNPSVGPFEYTDTGKLTLKVW